jgi:hypothetical protein
MLPCRYYSTPRHQVNVCNIHVVQVVLKIMTMVVTLISSIVAVDKCVPKLAGITCQFRVSFPTLGSEQSAT